MKANKLSFNQFQKIYAQVPRLCVDLVVKHKNGVVLTKRQIKPWQNMWHLPGGTVLLGETLRQAVQRVAQEELGIRVKIIRMLDINELFNSFKFKGYNHVVDIVYLVSPLSEKFKGSEQAKEIKVFKMLPKNIVKEHLGFLESHKKEIF